jgi:hypothetical protein
MSNQPAFPTAETSGNNGEYSTYTTPGLTKLEYGALKIAAGMCSTATWPNACDRHEIARRAVSIASAVLAEANT